MVQMLEWTAQELMLLLLAFVKGKNCLGFNET